MFAREESATEWVCQDCVILLANGETTDPEYRGDPDREPLSQLDAGELVTLGMLTDECAHVDLTDQDQAEEHAESCERDPFSTVPCYGCGSHLAGERHAVTVWGRVSTT